MPNKVKKRQLLDFGILIPFLILSVVGLMMVYSTTSYVMLSAGLNFANQAIKQLLFWILSVIVMTIIYKMKTDLLRSKKLTQFAMVVIFFMLLSVFAFPKVNDAYGLSLIHI